MEGWMKEKFTPGPWKVNEIGQHWNNKSLTHLEVTFGAYGECICDTVYQRGDANLIAAAPELLSVLQKIVESGHILPHLKIESKWAIAKALGESQ
jgi:hypothetical protein